MDDLIQQRLDDARNRCEAALRRKWDRERGAKPPPERYRYTMTMTCDAETWQRVVDYCKQLGTTDGTYRFYPLGGEKRNG